MLAPTCTAPREEPWADSVSLGTELPPSGRVTWVESGGVPDPLQCIQSQSFVCWAFSVGPLDPPPRPSRVWVMVQIGVLCGEHGRKLLFCHDDDATLCKSDFKLFSVILVAEIVLVLVC